MYIHWLDMSYVCIYELYLSYVYIYDYVDWLDISYVYIYD